MKIMLVDRDTMLSKALSNCLQRKCPTAEMVFCQTDSEALGVLQSLEVDLMLIDIACGELSAHEVISRALRVHPDMKILVHTDIADRSAVTSAVRAGAAGYLLKGISCDELWQAIHCVRSGGAILSPAITRIVIHELQIDSLAASLDILTDREKQVFQCMEDGTSYKAISLKLNISRNTVHTHVKNIYSKLQAVNKADALNKAKQIVAA